MRRVGVVVTFVSILAAVVVWAWPDAGPTAVERVQTHLRPSDRRSDAGTLDGEHRGGGSDRRREHDRAGRPPPRHGNRPLRDRRDDTTVRTSRVQPAGAAAMSIASTLDLTVDDAVVLHNSNKLALRLLPCDVLARVAPGGQEVARFEIELAQRLAETESPVAALEPRVEPRVYERNGFAVTRGPITRPRSRRGLYRPTTWMRSSGCMPACGSWTSWRPTSRIGLRRLTNWLRATTSLPHSPTRTGSC